MKASNRPLVIVITAGLILAICWYAIAWHFGAAGALGAGVALASGAALLIWFARSNRQAIARGILSVGATAFGVPAAGLGALLEDAVYSTLRNNGRVDPRYEDWEALMSTSLTLIALGAVTFLVSLIVGVILHRPEKAAS